MAEGTIDHIVRDRGFGFIRPVDGGDQVFFHRSALEDVRFDELQEGMAVEYEAEEDDKGLRATIVRLSGEVDEARGDFLNPYSFVRYLDKPRPQGHVLGDCPPPPHDRYIGLTGRITCELKAETPLFVSDSHAVQGKTGEHRTFRFFQVENEAGELEPALPATSLRGMVRSVFEATTNSCFAVFEGGGFDLREGRLPPGLVPARVVGIDTTGVKLERLDCSQGLPQNIRLHRRGGQTIPLINAASVSAYEERVLDTQTQTPFDPSRSLIPSSIKDGERVAALVDLNPVNNGVYQYFNVRKIVPLRNESSLQLASGTRKVFGYVHITGPNIERKHLERLFFRWSDTKPDIPDWQSIPRASQLTAPTATIEECNQHLGQYWERNQRRISLLDRKGKPWPVSADELPHPSYFIKENGRLREGDLVYYIPSSKIGIPVLRPILISRLPYRYDRASLLPDYLCHCGTYGSLCPACRVFGWVHENAAKLGKRERVAYAGRVRFSHGKLVGKAETVDDPQEGITLAILSTPKPTTTQFYLLKNGQPDSRVTYDDKERGAQLRGRKLYRHHGAEPSRHADGHEYERAGGIKDDQNRTVCGVLEKGTSFAFTVDFENLAPEELGALLWSLEMEKGMHHRLGYAKPLGFGSVTIRVQTVQVLQSAQRFCSLKNEGWATVTETQRDNWVKSFKSQMAAEYGSTFEKLLNIQDLKALAGEPDVAQIHYPRLESTPQPKGENFKWFVANKKRDRPYTLDLAVDDGGLPLDLEG